jgi:hypothetical protein
VVGGVSFGVHSGLKSDITALPKSAQQTTFAPRTDAIVTLAWAGRRRLALIGGSHLFSLSEHETFAVLIYCVHSGGTGKPAVVYKGRAESCPSGFFMGIGRVSFLIEYWQVIW